jgi:hypothetical protein
MARRRAKNSTRRNRILKTQRQQRSRRAEEYGGAGRSRAAGVRGKDFEPGWGTAPGDTDKSGA